MKTAFSFSLTSSSLVCANGGERRQRDGGAAWETLPDRRRSDSDCDRQLRHVRKHADAWRRRQRLRRGGAHGAGETAQPEEEGRMRKVSGDRGWMKPGD